ncbi:MarR family winged helix-turn-helix transcriptional regulator [Jiella avicenniae]|uniref:MarR family winged helix-turn-helix transcriptional regulator n=1 Tax=Jiella avicenniae TaxID=2907202 RepID=A0A9X1TD41_9HYPH|nr:MarR family winged helix-turn-helix transcriptional regulator [Jiella avicenniae]MCE7029653.1 MarR family winged helix-turn-helix transcriptional regulator [Jiella avicenniae]
MSLNGHQIPASNALRPDGHRFVPSLVNIMKSGRALITIRLAEIGLHPGQDHMLMQLDASGEPQLVCKIADAIGVRSSTASKMLDRLQSGGLVERTHGTIDRRHTMVSLTPKGRDVRDQVDELWGDVEIYILRGCPQAEVEAMCHATERLDALMAERLRRLR